MEELRKLLELQVNSELQQIVISNQKIKGGVKKIHIRPILLQNQLWFQFASYTEKQVFHENLLKEDAIKKIVMLMECYKQLQLESVSVGATVLVSKKNTVTIKQKKKKDGGTMTNLSHNRKKRYVIEPEEKAPFLVDLGVITSQGQIVASKTDKFKQINRFLEFVRDVEDRLPKEREAVIIDFGCGKSYLTFAMYYYLHEKKGYDVRMIGLDLKEDVIAHCNKLRDSYGYDKLNFLVGDIADYKDVDHVDMVVTLHACDTATDYALYKAVSWGARIILSVPCCQHELNQQMKKGKKDNALSGLFSYGIIQERSAALFTDAMRAEILKEQGYQVQLLEFIDMEHTPKNILIRAVKGKAQIAVGERAKAGYREAMEYLGVSPILAKLFDEVR
ncbi:MAG: SAM-dependent methyltransferase [Lachnospiraceae bacterium]|jgi:SAM-dependent methyltransferase|nr:SAM-dependent methyltransferase [Lachnospiraceae bacterium]